MRWPFRLQILLPMVSLMLAAIVGVSLFTAYLSAQRTRQQIENKLGQVAETLATSQFPLTDAVLEQVRGLTGAEFAVVNHTGKIAAVSSQFPRSAPLPADNNATDGEGSSLNRLVRVGGESYFRSRVPVILVGSAHPDATLHILYPERKYQQAWWEVVYPPLLIGGIATLLVMTLSFFIASRATRPLRLLRQQVGAIARGDFRLLDVPPRNDEISDLSQSVNEMATRLAEYESDVRRNERLRTLGQLGSGIAHQIRNAVTGCSLAVDLHRRECGTSDENLTIAKHQLRLMETFVNRFLALGKARSRSHRPVDLNEVVDNVLLLTQPLARHVGVQLTRADSPARMIVCGDSRELEQLLTNIVINAIEAASASSTQALASATSSSPATLAASEPTFSDSQPVTETTPTATAVEQCPALSAEHGVSVSLQTGGDMINIEIENSGQPPATDIESRMLEPFITDKPDGTGLGLSVANEIAMAHGGEIDWRAADGVTRFVVAIPAQDSAGNRPTDRASE